MIADLNWLWWWSGRLES